MQLRSCVAWLWYRPTAVALIGPQACEPPYAADAPKKVKKKTQKKLQEHICSVNL